MASLTATIASMEFTPREEAIARARGTTCSDLRNVALAKVRDLRQAVDQLEQLCEDGDTRDQLVSLRSALV